MKVLRWLWNRLAAPFRAFRAARSKAICEDALDITERVTPFMVTALRFDPDSKEAEAIWTMVFTTLADHGGKHPYFKITLGRDKVSWLITDPRALTEAARTAAGKYGRLY